MKTIPALVGLSYLFTLAMGIIVPPECIGQNICYTMPENYPQDIIDRELQNMQYIRRLKRQNNDHDNVPIQVDDNNNCQIEYQYKKPFAVKLEGVYKAVVQSEFLDQTVKTGKCGDENASCFNSFLTHQRAHCKSIYTTVSLSIFDTSTSKIVQRTIEIPVDCACSIE